MSNITSKHHIYPKSLGGNNSRENIIRLNHDFHIAFHRVFQNLPPHEQIGKLLEISATAITEDFKNEIKEILEDSEYIYKRGILIRR